MTTVPYTRVRARERTFDELLIHGKFPLWFRIKSTTYGLEVSLHTAATHLRVACADGHNREFTTITHLSRYPHCDCPCHWEDA